MSLYPPDNVRALAAEFLRLSADEVLQAETQAAKTEPQSPQLYSAALDGDHPVENGKDGCPGKGFVARIAEAKLQFSGEFAMVTWQEALGLQSRTADAFSSFEAYLDAEEELFVESMQDAAANHWDLIGERMKGATEQEIGAKMEKWWGRHIRRFRMRLRRKHERRENRRATIRRVHAEEQLRAMEVELDHAKGDLAAEQALTAFLKEQRRCRHCDGEL